MSAAYIKREFAYDFRDMPMASDQQPYSALQALMETLPFEEPRMSVEELAPIKEAIAIAIEHLTEREQWIANALFIEKLSLAKCGQQLNLSKTQVARVRDEIKDKLSFELLANDAVRMYLKPDTQPSHFADDERERLRIWNDEHKRKR